MKLFDADYAHVAPDLLLHAAGGVAGEFPRTAPRALKSAQTSLEIESMQFADAQVRQAVLERKQAGVAVRVLIAAPSWVSSNTSAGAWLVANQIPARWRKTPAVHVKAFVVDGKTVFLGSENLSRTSLDDNREVGLVSTEADDVALVSSTFEQDWAGATAF